MSERDGLQALGYGERWRALFEPYGSAGLLPGRVVRSDRGVALVATETGILRARPSTRLTKAEEGALRMPTVGDWVALFAPPDLDAPLIEAVLERSSLIARGDPGKTSESQALAANVDVVFVVHPIAAAPNLRRIERELALAWESGATPVVALTKADLSDDPEGARTAVEEIAFGVDVKMMNALSGDGVEELMPYISEDRTAVLIGPSGAGKSTITNALLQEERQSTAEVRSSDGRGRHTTVARELIPLPRGGILIDTPGLRALALTGSEEGISSVFPDIESAAAGCRFRDCSHSGEPGCAVAAAVEAGTIAAERLASYHKLLREAEVAAAKTDARLQAAEDRKAKMLSKTVKDYFKHTGPPKRG